MGSSILRPSAALLPLLSLLLFLSLFVSAAQINGGGGGGGGPFYECFSDSSGPCTLDTCTLCILGSTYCRLYKSTSSENGPFILNDTDTDADAYFRVCGYDCNDTNNNVNPGNAERIVSNNCNDNLDNDCDGLKDGFDPDCQASFDVTSFVASASGQTVTLTATTNSGAACKHSNITASFDLLTTTMTQTNNNLTHTATITNVPYGTHTYYVYCRSPP